MNTDRVGVTLYGAQPIDVLARVIVEVPDLRNLWVLAFVRLLVPCYVVAGIALTLLLLSLLVWRDLRYRCPRQWP